MLPKVHVLPPNDQGANNICSERGCLAEIVLPPSGDRSIFLEEQPRSEARRQGTEVPENVHVTSCLLQHERLSRPEKQMGLGRELTRGHHVRGRGGEHPCKPE